MSTSVARLMDDGFDAPRNPLSAWVGSQSRLWEPGVESALACARNKLLAPAGLARSLPTDKAASYCLTWSRPCRVECSPTAKVSPRLQQAPRPSNTTRTV